jgi:IclR family acetate operon transcriptional repressor
MKRLQSRFNETVNLGVLHGSEVMYLEIIESDWSLRMRAEVGATDPVHSTALGKALLAFRPPGQRDLLIPQSPKPVTRRTITDRGALLEQLEVIRTTGYSFEMGENEDGSCCLAAPICNESGVAIAALSVSGPAARMDDGMRQSICASLMVACGEISRVLRNPAMPE